MKAIEFYTFEGEPWCRNENGTHALITIQSRDEVRHLIAKLQNDYHPKAYETYAKHYKSLLPDVAHFQYRIARLFIRCNFGHIDNVPDIDSNGNFHFEYNNSCPMRGECTLEADCCPPKLATRISDSERRVLELVFRGCEKEYIAEKLCISLHTVNNHIRNAYTRLGFHEKAQFIDYAHRNNLFNEQ